MEGISNSLESAFNSTAYSFLTIIAGILVVGVSFTIATELKSLLLKKTNMKEGIVEIATLLVMLAIPAIIIALI